MNTLISYVVQPVAPRGWSVTVYVGDSEVAIHGGFKSWDDAWSAAQTLEDRVRLAARNAAEEQL